MLKQTLKINYLKLTWSARYEIHRISHPWKRSLLADSQNSRTFSSWTIGLLACAAIGLGTIFVVKTCAKKTKAAIELATSATGDPRPLDERLLLPRLQRNDLYYETRIGDYYGPAAEAPLDLIRPLSAGAHGTVYLAKLEVIFSLSFSIVKIFRSVSRFDPKHRNPSIFGPREFSLFAIR